MHRREFLTNTAISGTGFAILPTGSLLAENKKVKMELLVQACVGKVTWNYC